MQIFLCRHGQTYHNNNGIVQGQKDVELNDKGKKQAEKLASRFEDIEIDYFYSSSLQRAHETAKIVAQTHEASIETSDLLKEVNRAEFEGGDFEEMVDVIKNSEIEEHLWKPENGESLVDLQDRGKEFLDNIQDRHEIGDKILVMAHGGINGGIVLGALEHDPKNCFKIHQDNCCVNEINRTELHGWELVTVNDTSHM